MASVRTVLFKWDGAPLEASEFGWYRGTIAKRATPVEIKETPGVNFSVKFVNSETNNTLPFRFGTTKKLRAAYCGPKKSGYIALGLTKEVWGPEGKWMLLEKQAEEVA